MLDKLVPAHTLVGNNPDNDTLAYYALRQFVPNSPLHRLLAEVIPQEIALNRDQYPFYYLISVTRPFLTSYFARSPTLLYDFRDNFSDIFPDQVYTDREVNLKILQQTAPCGIPFAFSSASSVRNFFMRTPVTNDWNDIWTPSMALHLAIPGYALRIRNSQIRYRFRDPLDRIFSILDSRMNKRANLPRLYEEHNNTLARLLQLLINSIRANAVTFRFEKNLNVIKVAGTFLGNFLRADYVHIVHLVQLFSERMIVESMPLELLPRLPQFIFPVLPALPANPPPAVPPPARVPSPPVAVVPRIVVLPPSPASPPAEADDPLPLVNPNNLFPPPSSAREP
jgi:hypothetical protein